MEWWILSSSALAAKSAMRIYVLDPTWEGLEHIKLKTTIYNTLNIIPGIGSSANLPHLAKTLLIVQKITQHNSNLTFSEPLAPSSVREKK